MLERKLGGWPATLTHSDIARLQTWRKGIDVREWSEDELDWRVMLERAVEMNAIAPQGSSMHPLRRLANYLNARSAKWGLTQIDCDDRPVMEYCFDAPTLSGWVANQAIQPGPLLAAWFTATGAQVSRTEQPPEPESIAARNARWLAIHDEEARQGRSKGAQARAIARVVATEGVSAAAAKKGIQLAERKRSEHYAGPGVRHIARAGNSAADPFDIARGSSRR